MRVPSALCGDSCNASNISKVYLQILTSVIHTCTPWTDRIESSQPRSQVVIVIRWSTKGTVLYSFVFQTKGKSTTSWKDDKLRRKGVYYWVNYIEWRRLDITTLRQFYQTIFHCYCAFQWHWRQINNVSSTFPSVMLWKKIRNHKFGSKP